MYFVPGVLLPTLSLMINISGQTRFGLPMKRAPSFPIAYRKGPFMEYGKTVKSYSTPDDIDDTLMLQDLSKVSLGSPATGRSAYEFDDEIDEPRSSQGRSSLLNSLPNTLETKQDDGNSSESLDESGELWLPGEGSAVKLDEHLPKSSSPTEDHQVKFLLGNTQGSCPLSTCTLPVVITNSSLKIDPSSTLEMIRQVTEQLHKKMTVDGKEGIFLSNQNLSVTLPTDSPVPVVLVNKSIPVDIIDGEFNVTVLNVPLEVKSESLLQGMYSMLKEFQQNLTVTGKPGIFINNDDISVTLKESPVPVSLIHDSLTVKAADKGLGVFLLNDSVPVSIGDKVVNVNVQNAPLRVIMDGFTSSTSLNSTEVALKIASILTNNDCPTNLKHDGSSRCMKVRYNKGENRMRCICFVENKQKQQDAEVLCNLLGFDGLATRTDTGKNRELFLGLLKDLVDVFGIRAGEYYIAPNPERTCEIFSGGLVLTPKNCADKRNFVCEKALF